jgi:hypothetical protein
MAPGSQLQAPTPWPIGAPAAPEWLLAGSIWRLLGPINLYSRQQGDGLASQAWGGRHLQVLEAAQPLGRQPRLRIRLLDDGYPGWIEPNDLLGRAEAAPHPRPRPWNRPAIHQRLDAVIAFGLRALEQPNSYLWGGSLGPDFDCSGLVQSAYASQGIWLPRDAYLQERFCQPVAAGSGITHRLEPGDLIFFGSPQRCTHVGLHLHNGSYLHSSGRATGHNGLAIDNLSPTNGSGVASHYRQTLRGAGRVMYSHDGSPLPA